MSVSMPKTSRTEISSVGFITVSSIPSAIFAHRARLSGHPRCVKHIAGGRKGKGGRERQGRDITPPKAGLKRNSVNG
jgi:hypothetical protein